MIKQISIYFSCIGFELESRIKINLCAEVSNNTKSNLYCNNIESKRESTKLV